LVAETQEGLSVQHVQSLVRPFGTSTDEASEIGFIHEIFLLLTASPAFEKNGASREPDTSGKEKPLHKKKLL
jgi:hypothetical protein